MKANEIEVQELLADIKRLLNSAREDFAQRIWNTYPVYINEFNSILARVRDADIDTDIHMIGDAEHDEVEAKSFSFGYGSEPPALPMIPSIASKMRKMREIINAADKLLMKVSVVSGINSDGGTSSISLIENLSKRFHIVASQLRHRRENRPTFDVEDEYDVQDLLHALLRLHFEDVRTEEWTPSYAGGAARMDFLLKPEQIVIEAKKTRKSLGAKELGEQLIIDIEKYSKHPDCKTLICLVYDPDGRVINPRGVELDLNSRSDERIRVITFIKPSST